MKIKTVTTVGGVNPVYFGDYSPRFYWFKNLGSSTLYVSSNPNMIVGGDDVSELPPKSSTSIETDTGKIYILGAGKVEIHNTDNKFCPFRGVNTVSGGSTDARFYLIKDWKKIYEYIDSWGYTGLVKSPIIRGYSHFQHIYTRNADGIPRNEYSKIGISLAADEFYYISYSQSYNERKYVKLSLLSKVMDASMYKSINIIDGSQVHNQIDNKYILASALAPIEKVLPYDNVDYAYYNGIFYLDIPENIETLFIDIEAAALNVKINSLWLE